MVHRCGTFIFKAIYERLRIDSGTKDQKLAGGPGYMILRRMGGIEIKETALHPRGFVKCPLEPKRKPVILPWGVVSSGCGS